MIDAEEIEALVIGAGPAGLMAAEAMAAAGLRVVVTEAMPTPARKFLMAGKSGLNLTKAETATTFSGRITTGGADDDKRTLTQNDLRNIVTGFGPDDVQAWARDLGIALFAGSTGRVFPVGMKASPLLRAWLGRLASAGIELRTRWRWAGFDHAAPNLADPSRAAACFETPGGTRTLMPRVVVLALGGASWPRLGSNAAWVPWLGDAGVDVATFRPANMGFCVRWSPHMAALTGRAVKGAALSAQGATSRGEFVISTAGIEGGGIYEISAALRDGADGRIDLAPDLSVDALAARLGPSGKQSVGNRLRRALADPVKVALALEWGRPLPAEMRALAARLKNLPILHDGPLPLSRAISSAGGVRLSALTPDLGLTALPGWFAAGEMLDWEAPTGGYLLTTCLATGRVAGLAAARYAASARR